MKRPNGLSRMLVVASFAALLTVLWSPGETAWAQSSDQMEESVTGGTVPGGSLGATSDAEMWRAIRRGVEGTVSIPDKKAGVLVQSEGDMLRAFRNGPLSEVGGWALLGIFLVLGVFYALRGRIRIDGKRSGRTVLRFNFLERFTHWLTAGSFVILALTGLNMLYGKYVLIPVIGQSAFASLTIWGKYAHNFLGFSFTLGVLLMIVIWIRDNIPSTLDVKWLAKGGGLFTKGVHPPARKFNAGQKLVFWAVVILGLSVATTGYCLIFPFEFSPFGKTFMVLNALGLDLPTHLSPLHETQLALLWHSIVALALIIIIVAHIYIGSVGMEGAIDAVTTGEVDETWAHEHHSLWLDEMREGPKAGEQAPAE